MEDAAKFAIEQGLTKRPKDDDWQILHVTGYGDDMSVHGEVFFNRQGKPEYHEFG